jgi:capsular polysaccharide export protein
MTSDKSLDAAGEDTSRRLFVYNGGFLTQRRVRRILHLSGWDIKIGTPGPDDWVGVWGKSPTSPRGEAVANSKDARLLRVEDALLRSVLPGRSGEPPLGLHLDKTGVHFDSKTPSDLETLLATHPLDDTALLDRARMCSDWIRAAHLSKYNGFHPTSALPRAPYVVVIDQTKGDASIRYGAANAGTFHEMVTARVTSVRQMRAIILPCSAIRSALGSFLRARSPFTPSVPALGSRRSMPVTSRACLVSRFIADGALAKTKTPWPAASGA